MMLGPEEIAKFVETKNGKKPHEMSLINENKNEKQEGESVV